MPVAAFPGDHGWGYDGIGLWAVHEPYGGPDALKRFVDACHARGLAVYLDVVYNHVGPGNRLASFGPYFTDAHLTPWGPAVNLDQPGSDEVRAFIVDNALMWLRDYHLDGLRLDAVHALVDTRALNILEELAVAVDALAAVAGRSHRPGGRVRPQQPAADHGQAGGRLRARRAVERRLPPRRARAGDRRAAGVLQRLRRPRRGRQDPDQGVFPRRDLVGVPRPDPRPPGRHPADAGLPVRRVRPGSRPGRQPGGRRPPPGHAGRPPEPARAARDRVRPAAHRAVHADAVHGRGVGRRHAVAVLHRPHRSRAGGGGQRRPPVGVRRARLGSRRRPRPAGRGDVPPLQARLGPARAASRTARCSAGTAPCWRCADPAPNWPTRASTGCTSTTTRTPGGCSSTGASSASPPTWARPRRSSRSASPRPTPVPLLASAPGISVAPDAVTMPPATFAVIDLSPDRRGSV